MMSNRKKRRRATYPFLLLSPLTTCASGRMAGPRFVEPVSAVGNEADHHRARPAPAAQTSRTDATHAEHSGPVLQDDVPFSERIPPYETTMELLHLSYEIYAYRGLSSCEEILHGNTTRPLPPDATCHMYETSLLDTQVMVVSRPPGKGGLAKGYVAAVYAGTDDFRNFFTDGDIIQTSFGTYANGTYPFVPKDHPDIEVHMGFNDAVFKHGLFDRVLKTVQSVLKKHPHYEFVTTGHSLGASDAVLTSVAMSQKFGPDRDILCINFGCPRTGNRAWRDYVNGLPNVGIWRFVNNVDIVPRLPDARFVHVGHTVQLDKGGGKAYWFHFGDIDRGLAGVPVGWEVKPFIAPIYNGIDHMIIRYAIFLTDAVGLNSTKYYPHAFRRVDDDDDSVPQDDDFPPHDDDDTIGPPAYGDIMGDNAKISMVDEVARWYKYHGHDEQDYSSAAALSTIM